MPDAADHREEGALAALMAVTASPEIAGRPDRTLGALLGRVAAAAECERAAIWAPAARGGAGVAVVVHGAADRERAVSEALAGVAPPDVEAVVEADGPHPLSPAVRALGASRARAVPMLAGDLIAGVCLVGSPDGSGPSEHPVRVHAVRVGARAAGRIIEAARLRDDVERAMAQILLTDERMLGRMGLDIHDGPTQQLSVALLEVQLLEAELADAEEAGTATPDFLRPALARIYETVGGALHEMRELIGHLRPAQFEDRRLNDILQDSIANFERRADCTVESEWHGEFPVNGVSITQRITLYRILQETLNNAHRHGAARAVHVRVTEDESGVALDVHDDGAGFDAEAAQRSGARGPIARFGLHGMRDRAQILGGTFAISSTPGEGTSVSVFLPRWAGAPDEAPYAGGEDL